MDIFRFIIILLFLVAGVVYLCLVGYLMYLDFKEWVIQMGKKFLEKVH